MRLPPYDEVALLLRVAVCFFSGVAAIRLFLIGLAKRYLVLFLFLTFHMVRALALFACAWFPRPRNAYAWTWVSTEPILLVIYVWLALDLYSLVLRDYKGLQTVGRWIFLVALPIAILISGASVLSAWQSPTERVPVVNYIALANRGVMFSVLIFILLTLFLLSWYPISLSRNIVIYHVIYMAYLVPHSMAYLVRNVQGEAVTHAANLAVLVTTLFCFSAWAFLLSPAGELKKVVFRRQFTAEDERRLVEQLTAINSSLMRATRK